MYVLPQWTTQKRNFGKRKEQREGWRNQIPHVHKLHAIGQIPFGIE